MKHMKLHTEVDREWGLAQQEKALSNRPIALEDALPRRNDEDALEGLQQVLRDGSPS